MKFNRSASNIVCAAFLSGLAFNVVPTVLLAQVTPAVPAVAVAQPAVGTVVLAEGTELRLQFNERLSSATNRQGDTFTITLTSPITLADGTVIPAGFRGRGEVTAAERRGMMGRGGELAIRLEYLRIGPTRVSLRANKSSEGAASTGATIALTVLFGPLGLLKRGKDIDIPRGQEITAFVDSPTNIPLPIGAPPASE
jgi:hypothetical protein